MKKSLLIMAMAMALAVNGIQQVGAWGGPGGRGPGNCWQNSGAVPEQMDEETQKIYTEFKNETKELRREMAVARAQMRALMQGSSPDQKEVGDVAARLFDLRANLMAMAEKSGMKGAAVYSFSQGPGGDCNGPGSRGGCRGPQGR